MAEPNRIADYLAEVSRAPADVTVHSRILYLIHELSRLIATNFDKSMLRHKLTHGQWWAMMHIIEHPGATQSDLAAIMQMTRASAGKLLERMEAKGWIERRSDPTDNRVRRVYLTDGAVPVFKLMGEEGGRLFETLLGSLDRDSETKLLEALQQIRSSAQSGLSK